MNLRGLALVALLGAASVLAPASLARAQELAGALSAGPIISDGDVGGGAWLELWAAFDWFRIGGMTGALTIPSARDSHNRFATPLAVSIAAIVNLGDVDLDFRLRGGMWGGSTQEVKMTAGGFVGGAAFLDAHLGGGATLGAGLEVWGFLGAGATWAIAPTLTLTFGPAPPSPATPEPVTPSTASPE
jgi:hypothetical protein